jgi:hypothetical protein
MARRDIPLARCTAETPPKPRLMASLAAMMRRVRSSKSGHNNSNFCVSSGRVPMPIEHITSHDDLIPLFIYAA